MAKYTYDLKHKIERERERDRERKRERALTWRCEDSMQRFYEGSIYGSLKMSFCYFWNFSFANIRIRIYRSLKMIFSYFWNFSFANIRITLAKNLFGTETWDLQVRFRSRVAFHNWCFKHYHYFILTLIRVTDRKFWWNEIASSRTRNFEVNGHSFTWIFQK